MQQRKLNDYHRRNIAVELEKCEVKAARQGEGYEVMLNNNYQGVTQKVRCGITDS